MRNDLVAGLGLLLALGSAALSGADASNPPDTQPGDALAKRVTTWIEQLSDGSPDVRDAAQAELTRNGRAALDALLRARTCGDPERTRRVEDVLNVLRARICLAATRQAIRIEIEYVRQQISEYEQAATQPVNQNRAKELRQSIRKEEDKLKELQDQAARFAKMTPALYALPAPLHLDARQDNGPSSPKWDLWDMGQGLAAWRPAPDKSWLMYCVGMSRSGPFYRAIASATPIPKAPRLAVAAYPLFRGAYPFPEYYVYLERRDYPLYASASQRIDDLLKMPKQFEAWLETAKELAALARTDPSTKPLLRKLAIPALREAAKQQHDDLAVQAAIRDAIQAIESDAQPATLPATHPATNAPRPACLRSHTVDSCGLSMQAFGTLAIVSDSRYNAYNFGENWE